MDFAKFINSTIDDMEKGVFNFCENGKCIGCGQCCSNFLPLSSKEIKEIKRYIAKHKIKEHKHIVPTVNFSIDLTCPFLNDKDCDKCDIYEVRPMICRVFQCNQPPSKVKQNKHLFWKDREPCDMREIFFKGDN